MPITPGGRFSPGDSDEWDLTTDLAAMQVSNETATQSEIAAAVGAIPTPTQAYRTGTNAERLAIPAGQRFEGLEFYARDTRVLWIYEGSTWKNRARAMASYVTTTPAPLASFTPSFTDPGREVDTHSFWSSGAPTRLTAPFAGTYELIYSVRTNGTAAMTVTPRVNGAGQSALAASSVGAAGAATHTQFAGILTLAAGDYIDLAVTYASTGGSGTYRLQMNYLGQS